MFEKLKNLLNNSKTDYYNFRVSSIIVTNDNNYFEGVNVETSSPNASICAERNALFSSISKGYTKSDFKELHVMVDSDKFSYPCFICRQAFCDYLDDNVDVYLYSKNKLEKTLKIKDLLCFKFDNEDLS